MTDDAAARLLTQISETALRPDLWPGLLDDLASFAGARGAFLIPLNGDAAGLQVTASLDALLDSYVREGWAQNDFRYRGKAKMLRDGITVDQDFVDADTMRREPFYTAFLASHGLKFFAGLSITSGADSWALTLQRGLSAEPFGAEEQTRLRSLVAPLQDAVRAGRALQAAYATGSLDQLSAARVACLLLDRSGRIVHLNEAAESLLGSLIDVTHGRMRLKAGPLSRDLDRQVRIALHAPSFGAPAASAPIVVGHPKPEWLVRVTPLPRSADTIFRTCRGMIQIRPIRGTLDIDAALVEQTYSLTKREAEILSALLRHSNLADAARAIGVSYETARSHIKSILAKTGTRSQVELVAAMANYAR